MEGVFSFTLTYVKSRASVATCSYQQKMSRSRGRDKWYALPKHQRTASSFQNSLSFIPQKLKPLHNPLSTGLWLAASIFKTVRHFQRITKRIWANWDVKEPQINTRELVRGSHGVAANCVTLVPRIFYQPPDSTKKASELWDTTTVPAIDLANILERYLHFAFSWKILSPFYSQQLNHNLVP